MIRYTTKKSNKVKWYHYLHSATLVLFLAYVMLIGLTTVSLSERSKYTKMYDETNSTIALLESSYLDISSTLSYDKLALYGLTPSSNSEFVLVDTKENFAIRN